MDFRLTKEQELMKEVVRSFTRREIESRASEIDSEGKIPDDVIRKMSGIRLLGMTISKEYGGMGATDLDCALAVEQVAYSGTGAWWLVAFTSSIPEGIEKFGSEEQKRTYLNPVCEGTMLPSIQFTESETGSDPKALTTTVLPKGDTYVIKGMKRFSTFGSREGYAVLYGKDDTGQVTAFIVPKFLPGYSVSKVFDLMGGGGIEATDVYYDEVEVPVGNMLGEKGGGFNILQRWIAIEKIQQCAACVGIAQAGLDEALRFAKTRNVRKGVQADLQGIQWLLAEMYSRLGAARCLAYRAAFLKEADSGDWMTEAAAAKVFVVPTAMEVVDLARRVHGSYGYTKEFKIERLYRAVAGASVIAVSNEINKSIVAASLIR